MSAEVLEATTAPTRATRASQASWEMPHVHKGQIVLWYEGGVKDEACASPALVGKVTIRGVMVHVFKGDSQVPLIRDCVRHMDDPFAKDDERLESGAWDYAAWDFVKE